MVHASLFQFFFYSLVTHNCHSVFVYSVTVMWDRTYKRTMSFPSSGGHLIPSGAYVVTIPNVYESIAPWIHQVDWAEPPSLGPDCSACSSEVWTVYWKTDLYIGFWWGYGLPYQSGLVIITWYPRLSSHQMSIYPLINYLMINDG